MNRRYINILIFFFGIFYGLSVAKFHVFPYYFFVRLKNINQPKLFYPYSKEQIQNFERTFSSNLKVLPSNIDSMRFLLRSVVFGSKLLPKALPNEIVTIVDDNYSGMENLNKLEKVKIELDSGFISIGYIFHPKNKNNRLMLYYQGHDGDFLFGKSTILYFLDLGYTIYTFSLPLLGKNNRPVVVTKKYGTINFSSNHDFFKFLSNPLKYFVAPVHIMINYAKTKHFDNISMSGISGGGWATTISAALDERINYSFPVAGSYPNLIRFLKPENNYGDYEQTIPDLVENFDYLDLYILGSAGVNRAQTQILNLYDPCCFNGFEYQLYDHFLNIELKKYTSGNFKVFIDSLNKNHSISSNSLNRISKEIDFLSK